MSEVEFFTVTDDEHGQRLDNYLLARLKGMPKSAVYRIVRTGQVRVNKGRAKPDRRLVAGDSVRVPPVRLAEREAPPKPSGSLSCTLVNSILFDSDGLLVVNKPSGLAVHGGSGVNLGLVEALRQMPTYKGFLELIHRLDRDTSGCVMLARKRAVLKEMQDKLRAREGVEKTYLALVQGRWPANVTFVDVPLQRTVLANNERLVRVSKEGKPSLTHFKVLARHELATLVMAKPVTGRTHQIRVHARHVGCPLVGDLKYGDNQANTALRRFGAQRLFLHAFGLACEFAGRPRLFRAELPADLLRVAAALDIDIAALADEMLA